MYKRIVLKLSCEVLAGPRGFGLDAGKVAEITGELVDVHALGVEIGVVVGGGNIFRGMAASAQGMDRAQADYIGMLATVMNAVLDLSEVRLKPGLGRVANVLTEGEPIPGLL